jgi:hypothetical protein
METVPSVLLISPITVIAAWRTVPICFPRSLYYIALAGSLHGLAITFPDWYEKINKGARKSKILLFLFKVIANLKTFVAYFKKFLKQLAKDSKGTAFSSAVTFS